MIMLSEEELAQYHLMGPQRTGKGSRSIWWGELVEEKTGEMWSLRGAWPIVGSLEDRGRKPWPRDMNNLQKLRMPARGLSASTTESYISPNNLNGCLS